MRHGFRPKRTGGKPTYKLPQWTTEKCHCYQIGNTMYVSVEAMEKLRAQHGNVVPSAVSKQWVQQCGMPVVVSDMLPTTKRIPPVDSRRFRRMVWWDRDDLWCVVCQARKWRRENP